ncbi:MAG TPA: glycosyltransferase [Acetobacteraceae bacterium]|nr:glycosyltransferase [Acetobacteraceae bacterium]
MNLALGAEVVLHRALAACRALHGRSPWLAAQLRRVVLLVWWTLSLQLHRHARLWLQARSRRRAEPSVDPLPLPLAVQVDPDMLMLPHSDMPVVSVIVPTYGKTDFTLRCLASIAEHKPDVAIEVIVVDDAYPGPETLCLDRIRGVRLIRHSANLGFIHACNAAARLSLGEYVLFLNNDTQVLAGWLDPMLALFDQRADTGAVGAKLLYPDGRLQEAGGIIWRDGTGWNYGRHDDPAAPVYNYVREADYCSGAALLVRRAVFLQLGGFDERYAPAYFEDSDLCFRLRAAGLRTLYQPRARIMHIEGVSHGRDMAEGVKSYQVINRRSFVRVWHDVLAHDHFASGTHVLRARDRAHHRPVILVVDHIVPQPDRDAGSCTMMHFLTALTDSGFVVKFWPYNLCYSAGYTEALQDRGIEVFYGPGHASFTAWMREYGRELDHVLLCRPDIAEDLMPTVRRFSGARVLYYGHDLHFRRLRQQGEVVGDEALLRSADRMEQTERLVWGDADVVLYPSEEEAAIVGTMRPGATALAVQPYCFDNFAADRGPPPGREIIFVAGFGHPPNEDAVCWFTRTVLPQVLARMPDVHFTIVGSNPTKRVRALANQAVSVTGSVSSAALAALYQRARVAVVPLRCGAGVKLKVVEALCEGVPLVTTPVGAQGLPGLSELVPVETDAEAFAVSVCALLHDNALWRMCSAAQVRYARRHFRQQTLRESLLRALNAPIRARASLAA